MPFSSLAKGQLLTDVIAVDNNVMMRWLFNDGSEAGRHYAQKILCHIEKRKPQVLVLYLWVYEASFFVNYYTKKGMVSFEEGMTHLGSLFDLCLVIRGEETPSELFEFADTNGLSTYDSSYAMLALQQAQPIATLDKGIIRASARLNFEIFF